MKRNKFSLSNYRLLTADMGKLIPINLTEILPGDSVQQATSALVRTSPLLAPVMHPVNVRIHHWFVPHRIIWDGWEEFITGGPTNTATHTFPTKTITVTKGALADYLGIPPGTTIPVSALPFRAYSLIFNEFYRDQDLVTELTISKADGNDTTTNENLQSVAWEKDYFTSSRPWAQKGTSVTMPLGQYAPVEGIGLASPYTFGVTNQNVHEGGGHDGTYPNAAALNSATSPWFALQDSTKPGYPNIYANLGSATSASINDLRLAFSLQRYAEARARYGSRYTEYLRYLGVKSSDARLQRPEYLGGGINTIQFSEVLRTGAESAGTNIGEMFGHGMGAVRSNRYRRFFEEHGYIISCLSVLPKTLYMDGIPRTWNRRAKEDFYQKELEHIGQQEVQNKEVYSKHTTPDGTWGFQDRFDEYRRSESTIHGDFRDTLNHWHFGRTFAAEPVLNGTFVSADPTKQPFADQTSHPLWIMVNNSIQARRMLSKFGNSFIY